MNQTRMIIGLTVAILVALVLSIFVYRQFKAVSVNTVAMTTHSIVVAAQPLTLGTRLDPLKLKIIAWPDAQPINGMVTKVEDVAGRALITNVAENEPILESNLASAQSGAGLPATIPDGMRAVSVAVNDVVGVAGFVIPGTMVDVLATGAAQGGQGNVTKTILENVRVMAAGQKIEQDRDGKPQTVPVITLLVSPDDAARLTMASLQGRIQLALRNTADIKATSPAPVLQSAIFGGPLPPPAPVRPVTRPSKPSPPPNYIIEVISGDKRENKTFPNASATANQ